MQGIDCHEILQMQAAGTPLLCIDVREKYRVATFDAGGLKVPYNEVAKHKDTLALYNTPGRVVVVCCFNDPSQRAKKAAQELRKIGFTDIRTLTRGLWYGWYIALGAKIKIPIPA